MMSSPWGRSQGLRGRQGPPRSSTSIRTCPGLAWQRTVKVLPRDWVWMMALAASSLAIRIVSAAAGEPVRWAARSRRTWATWSARPWNVRWYPSVPDAQ
jgi:hypothetical protein